MMGVLNLTPDSFSDGGRFMARDQAVAHALELAQAGCQIVDLGGESTRPGARAVPLEEEWARVGPVLHELAGRLSSAISIDTRKAEVARRAILEGATIVNDVSALTFDPAMASVVARARVAVVLMHMRGTPATMMSKARYHDLLAEVSHYLLARAAAARQAGIARSRIVLDPGIGFAKRARHNFAILGGMARLRHLGYPLLIGPSRKAFIGRVAGTRAEQLLFGTAAATAIAVAGGAAIVRVHDPAPLAAVVKVAAAVARARS